MPGSEPTDFPADAEDASPDAADPSAETEPPLDENLAALAEAEAEIEQVEARFLAGDASIGNGGPGPRLLALQRRHHGHPVWGAMALGSVLMAWGLLFISGASRSPVWRATLSSDAAVVAFVGFLMAAMVFGTIGCRGVAGRRMALVGRMLAWNTPALGYAIIWSTVQTGDVRANVTSGLSVLVVSIALGLFLCAIFDAILEP